MDDQAMVRLWTDDARRHRDQAQLAQILAVKCRENAARSTARAEMQEQLWRMHTAAADKLEATVRALRDSAGREAAAALQAQAVALRSAKAKAASECACPEDGPGANRKALAAPRTKQ